MDIVCSRSVIYSSHCELFFPFHNASYLRLIRLYTRALSPIIHFITHVRVSHKR